MLHSHLLEAARAISDEVVALRRAIHAEPELGLHTPRTRDKVLAAGYNLREIGNSECAKLDGGMSCLSLRFSPSA